MKIYPQVLMSFVKPKTWLFHVVVLLTTATKWTKVKNASAGRAKLLFLTTKYANSSPLSLLKLPSKGKKSLYRRAGIFKV